MAQEKPTKQEQELASQSLVDYVLGLRKLNDSIDTEIPEDNIEEIMDNPEQYALDYIEATFAKFLPKYMEAYKLGDKFAKELLEV